MSATSPTWACDLKQWQEILGHCNISDAIKLEHVADGMKITDKTNFECDVWTKKFTQYQSKNPHMQATKILELVYTDLAGPIIPTAKDSFN